MSSKTKLKEISMKGENWIPLSYPGEILLEEFLNPAGISQYRLAKAAGLPSSRLTDIIKGRRGITADTAIRLGKTLGTTPKFWLNLQRDYDVRMAIRENGADYAALEVLAVTAG